MFDELRREGQCESANSWETLSWVALAGTVGSRSCP